MLLMLATDPPGLDCEGFSLSWTTEKHAISTYDLTGRLMANAEQDMKIVNLVDDSCCDIYTVLLEVEGSEEVDETFADLWQPRTALTLTHV